MSASFQITNRLLCDIKWPNDLKTIAALHGSSWMFYLVSHIRRHLINHLDRINFIDRDPKEAYPYIIELMDAFNPITILKLHHLLLEYYRGLVIRNELPFNEQWYLNLLSTISGAPLFQEKDWYWKVALQQVIFVTHRGTSSVTKHLPGWNVLHTNEKHSGVPEEYLSTRFDNLTTRIGDELFVASNDVASGVSSIGNFYTDTKRWEIICSPTSPFIDAVQNPDHFFLSLYPRVEQAQFAFAMALDIIQHNFTLTDWRVNKLSTKHYWKLCHADTRGLLRLNIPQIIPTQFDPRPSPEIMEQHIQEYREPGSTNLFQVYPLPSIKMREDDSPSLFSALQPPKGEDYFQSVYLSNKLLAIDMLFDYAADATLEQLLITLQSGAQDTSIPRSEQWTYSILYYHFKKKVDLFNQLNQNMPTQ